MVSNFKYLYYKVVRVFCLKLKISITIEPIGLSFSGKLLIGPMMVLGFIFRYLLSWDGLKPFSSIQCAPSNTELQDTRCVAVSYYVWYIIIFKKHNISLNISLIHLILKTEPKSANALKENAAALFFIQLMSVYTKDLF